MSTPIALTAVAALAAAAELAKRGSASELDDIERVFRSHALFTGFQPVQQVVSRFKPSGLWYSCGSEWNDWCKLNMPEEYTKKTPYNYRIHVNLDSMRVIRNDDEFLDFEWKYRTWRHGFMLIDWEAVARDYEGIEICPYLQNQRMGSDWYYPWDVASGCIWGAGAFRSVERLPDCP
jgi:hypothetical protein